MNREYSEYNIDGIGKNTEKSPGDLKRLAVTQTCWFKKLVRSKMIILALIDYETKKSPRELRRLVQGAEAKYGKNFKMFFFFYLIGPIF